MMSYQHIVTKASFSEGVVVPEETALCVQDVFQHRVQEQPDAPAVCAWDGDLTYKELDDKSSALARLLVRNGVQAGAFVPLCLDRSQWTAVAMLAVAKASGAFCFLEPKYPLARLQHMCHQLNAQVVLSSESQLELATKFGEHLVVLTLSEKLLATSPPYQQLAAVAPCEAAYVAFTSGSTGKPKGIIVSHQALVAGILYNKEATHLSRASRVLHFASFAFDISFLEHFWALLVGGCLCILSEFDRENNLIETIERLQVSWMFLTPSVARVLDPTTLPSLRHLGLGGEPVTQTDLDMWLPYVQVIGIYGPAECAGCTTVQNDYRNVESWANIGFSHAVACWVVDGNNHDVLIQDGSIGELVIQGPSLSEGYLNDPEQTAKSYISNPVWLPRLSSVEHKVYKTGDLVRRLPDGSLIFIDRKDMQVKINGQRIELQEVEHHMRAVLGGYREVLVEAVTARSLPKSLFAFIVADKSACSSTELFLVPNADFRDRMNTAKSLLHARLPSYMIPKFFLIINHIPLTVTGKADRRYLREQVMLLPRAQIMSNLGQEDKGRATTLTPTEIQLQRLWANVLKLEPHEVGRDDEWTSLGGDSLGAMQLVSLARQEQLFLTVPDILRHKTIFVLCQHAKSSVPLMAKDLNPFTLLSYQRLKGDQLLRAIADQCQVSPDSIEDAFPITSLQLDAALVPIQLGYNYTLRLNFNLPVDVDLVQLALAWESVVVANPVLRMRIVELTKDHYIQAVIKERIPFETLDSSKKAWCEPSSVDIWGLGKRLVRVGVQANRLIMLIHHAIYDGQSLPLIFRDISCAYQGQKLVLTHFAPFVQWSRESSASKHQFWVDKFAGFDGKVFPPVLDPSLEPIESRELTGKLDIINNGFTATNKIRLAWAIMTSWYSGTNDVVFGGVFTRRSAPIADIIDSAVPTTAMLPDRILLDPNKTLRYNLETDQESLLSMMIYEGIDDRTIEQLSPECKAACQYGTLLAVQPDLDTAYPEMFREREMKYCGQICALNALMQCCLTPGSATISLRLSESTMKGVYAWEQFLEGFQAVFHSIQKDLDVNLRDLQSQLNVTNMNKEQTKPTGIEQPEAGGADYGKQDR
ncbi:hypothetical protein BJ170DRAFT_646230 [Xylariales sp. AK1849]|nr:hypothetical protein BJ170DRAFT_646230 [Xylariales sp. AK1849]